MINASRGMEKLLQRWRFRAVSPYLSGDVLDFGGNEGELRAEVRGRYTLVNYDHAPLAGARADTIVMLAVMEHMSVAEVYAIFARFKEILNPGGRIFLTTPTPAARPVLELMSAAGMLDRHNIAEHQHYWTRGEIYALAAATGFTVKKYKKFQLIFNQYAVLEHAAGK